MKIIMIYTTVILVLIAIAIQLMSFKSTSNTETYKYKVENNIDGIEIREYYEAMFIKTNLNNDDYENISGNGFKTLAGYIFGANSDNKNIPMTSPVIVDMSENREMQFMVPSNYKLDQLPKPNSSSIEFTQKKKHRSAAITFGGWADENKIQVHIEKLNNILDVNNIKHKGNFAFYGYNPPYEITNRRNEVIVELIDE
jgi:hypothetical protein